MKYKEYELNNLEWWRGVLCFIVFISHLIQIVWFPTIGIKSIFHDVIFCLANVSVIFFFALSGILISYSIINISEDHYFNWIKYLVNRLSRIYPSLIFVILLSAILVILYSLINKGNYNIIKLETDKYLVRDFYSTDFKSIIKTFFMLQWGMGQINGSIWSLFIEWWLYISAMFLFLAIKVKNYNIFKFIYFFLSIIVLYLSYYGYGIKVIFYLFIWYLGFIYTLYFRYYTKKYNIICILTGCLFILILFFNGIKAININTSNWLVYGLIQIIYSIFFIKICFKYSGKYLFREISKYSYTLYIIHFPIILFIFALLHQQIKNNYLLLSIESVSLLIIVMLLSKYVALFTENKYLFRNIIIKIINI